MMMHEFTERTGYTPNYDEQANGAFEMLQILGLSSEYINWAIGK